MHPCIAGVTRLPALSFCLRDSGFTGEIPLHLRRPIEWDSPELCPYTVSCSSERLIVLLLRQRGFGPLIFQCTSSTIFCFLASFGTRSEFPLRKPAVHCGIYSQALPDPIHTLRILILWNHFWKRRASTSGNISRDTSRSPALPDESV